MGKLRQKFTLSAVKGVIHNLVLNEVFHNIDKLLKTRSSCDILAFVPKRVYQPKKLKRARNHGYRARVATAGGIKVIKRRRAQGRARLTI